MDTMPLAAPAASTRHALRFEGTAGEYFKIWIVNLALGVLRLWASSAPGPRSEASAIFTATLLSVRMPSIITPSLCAFRRSAVGMLVAYSLAAIFARPLVGLLCLIFAIAFPWLLMSSLRFSARNTSYRNVRFDFQGTYGGAFKAFVLWQLWPSSRYSSPCPSPTAPVTITLSTITDMGRLRSVPNSRRPRSKASMARRSA